MAQLNTRIVLRHDSTAKWLENKEQVLLKGELGLEFLENGKVKIKIGDGIKAWDSLGYYGDVEVNENTLVFEDDKLTLLGFATAEEGAQLVKSADGKLSWIVPDTTTVSGLQTAVTNLQTNITNLDSDLTALEEKVGNSAFIDEESGEEIPATGLFADIADLEANKANKNDVYTKDETDSAIATAVANSEHLKRVTVANVEEISTVWDNDENYIYMVPAASEDVEDSDHYNEYMVINGVVEKVGDWKVDLSEYAKTNEVNVLLSEYTKTVDINSALDTKVDKADGYRLMAETEGNKLAGIADGAEVNVINGVNSNEFSIVSDDNNDRVLNIVAVDHSKVTGLAEALEGKVDKVEGKGLSTNDLTDNLVAKIEASQTNVLEAVKINGSALAIDENKAVDIPIATAEALGVVKSNEAENGVVVAADGAIGISTALF